MPTPLMPPSRSSALDTSVSPTGLALQAVGFPVIGLDISESRLTSIADASVDLLARDRRLLIDALDSGRLQLSALLVASQRRTR